MTRPDQKIKAPDYDKSYQKVAASQLRRKLFFAFEKGLINF